MDAAQKEEILFAYATRTSKYVGYIAKMVGVDRKEVLAYLKEFTSDGDSSISVPKAIETRVRRRYLWEAAKGKLYGDRRKDGSWAFPNYERYWDRRLFTGSDEHMFSWGGRDLQLRVSGGGKDLRVSPVGKELRIEAKTLDESRLDGSSDYEFLYDRIGSLAWEPGDRLVFQEIPTLPDPNKLLEFCLNLLCPEDINE